MKILFRKSFARDLRNRKSDIAFLEHVETIIEEIENSENISNIPNLKKLKGGSDYYRIRFGSYRIGVMIENDLITFVRILYRREIYRYFP